MAIIQQWHIKATRPTVLVSLPESGFDSEDSAAAAAAAAGGGSDFTFCIS